METTIFKIKFKNGSMYKVFCANRSQKNRFILTLTEEMKEGCEVLENGIHNINQWEDVVSKMVN